MILAVFAVATFLALAGTIAFFVYANRRQQSEEVLLRFRSGDDAVASTVVSEAEVLNPVLRWACHLMWRAGSQARPPAVATGLWVIAGLVPLLLVMFGWFVGLFVIAGTGISGLFVIDRFAASRRARIIEQLPGFLEAVMRVLAAGNTLEEAIAAGARESKDPLRSLFVSVSRQVRLGAVVDVVLSEAADIHQIRDLRVLALAANINRKYGGTLRNVFRSLIQAIRTREAASRELRALTAETRFSAFVLAVIPIAVSTFIFFMNRTYYADLMGTKSGQYVLMSAVGFQVVGMLVIWRMMRSASEGDV